MEPTKSTSWRKLTKSRCNVPSKFRQNLLAGRYCESNYECLSFNCTDNKCKGKSSGVSCSDHNECETGLGCIAEKAFPFSTTCNSFKKQGETCSSDYDCAPTMFCWYLTRSDFYSRSKKCMLKWSFAVNTTFGWAPLHYDTVKDILWNGQACSTGLAIPIYDDTTLDRPNAMCVNITKIVTDQGTYNKPNTDVPQCLAANKGSYCTYFYNTTHNFKTRCYCAADGSLGYCPLPSLAAMKTYTIFE